MFFCVISQCFLVVIAKNYFKNISQTSKEFLVTNNYYLFLQTQG